MENNNFITKKGDTLYLKQDDDLIAILILNTIKYNNENYLKVLPMPINAEKLFDKTIEDAEFAREIRNDEGLLLDPVTDQATIDALNEIIEKEKLQTSQDTTPQKS